MVQGSRSRRSRGGLRRVGRAFAVIVLALGLTPSFAAPRDRAAATDPKNRLVLYVPATEGSGMDQTAIAMKAALEAEGLVGEVAIVRHPGAGGLVGLAQFIGSPRGDPRVILMGGSSIVYAAKTNRTAVTLLDTTPVARLIGDYQAVAVSVRSPLHSLADLQAVLKARPTALHWMGGPTDGPGEQLA